MENLGKRCNVELVSSERQLVRLAARPTYISSKILNKNLITLFNSFLPIRMLKIKL